MLPPSPFAQGRELGVVFVCFLSLLNPPPFARLLHRLTLPDRPRTSVLNQFTSLCLHGHQSHASLHRITPTVANITSALVPPRAVLIPSPSSGRGSSNRNGEPFSDDSATLRLALAPIPAHAELLCALLDNPPATQAPCRASISPTSF